MQVNMDTKAMKTIKKKYRSQMQHCHRPDHKLFARCASLLVEEQVVALQRDRLNKSDRHKGKWYPRFCVKMRKIMRKYQLWNTMRKLPDLDLLKLSDSGDTRDNFFALFRVTSWYGYKKSRNNQLIKKILSKKSKHATTLKIKNNLKSLWTCK